VAGVAKGDDGARSSHLEEHCCRIEVGSVREKSVKEYADLNSARPTEWELADKVCLPRGKWYLIANLKRKRDRSRRLRKSTI